MQKMCPNGHRFDPSIYGDQCPLCAQGAPGPGAMPPQTPKTNINAGAAAYRGAMPPQPMDGHTHIAGAQPAGGFTPPAAPRQQRPSAASEGETRVRPEGAVPRPQAAAQPQGAPQHTVIRRPGAGAQQPGAGAGRKLVGFLVTYNRHPLGRSFNLYEGKNTIGRDSRCDISLPDDSMMSGTHLSILYRGADNKFKFRDEQSSNGTYVNKELIDDGELNNYDVIRAGSTIFIFIAIPKLG